MTTSTDASTNQAVAEAIQAALPEGRVVVDRDVVRGLSQDQAAWAPVGLPAAVVRAHSTDEVRRVVEVCLQHGVSVVARGAGTGLSGGANATDGCVVLSLEAMAEIVRIDPLERLAVVQPGVVNDDLRAAVARARPVVSAGSGQFTVVHHRRQRRDECGWSVLREVRRDP